MSGGGANYGDMLFKTGMASAAATEKMRITYNGNVGISTTSPNEHLEIGSDGRAFFGDGNGATRSGLLIDGTNSSGGYARIESYKYGTGGIPLSINPSGGLVGIGTTSPVDLVSVRKDQNAVTAVDVTNNFAGTGAYAEFYSQTNAGYLSIGNTSSSYTGYTGDAWLWLSSNNNLRIATNNTEAMRITGAGNVGIGTTSPAVPLDVNGYIRGTNVAALTADFTDANAAGLQAITGLSFTLPASVALNVPFECNLMYSQATMVSDSFGIGLVTYAPTRIDAEGVINTAAAGTQASAALTNLTTTTPTAIVSGTPGVTNTVYFVRLAGLVQNASNAGTNTLNFYVSQATAADVVKVKAGSWCKIW